MLNSLLATVLITSSLSFHNPFINPLCRWFPSLSWCADGGGGGAAKETPLSAPGHTDSAPGHTDKPQSLRGFVVHPCPQINGTCPGPFHPKQGN